MGSGCHPTQPTRESGEQHKLLQLRTILVLSTPVRSPFVALIVLFCLVP